VTAARARTAAGPARILLGVVVGAQGVRGHLRVRSFAANPLDLGAYGPLLDEAGGRVALRDLRPVPGTEAVVIARVAGIADRDAALALKGTRLYVDREALPAPGEGEFYCSDLVGLAAERPDGTALGRVTAVLNHGGGDVLEIAAARGRTLLLPFTAACVPVVDVAGGRLVVDPPAEVEARPRRGPRR
jgi:16S rRNA processing protein RimM